MVNSHKRYGEVYYGTEIARTVFVYRDELCVITNEIIVVKLYAVDVPIEVEVGKIWVPAFVLVDKV